MCKKAVSTKVPGVLFQITEEDVLSLIEEEKVPFSQEDIDEIIQTISDMDAEAVLLDLFITYVQNIARHDIQHCMGCDKRDTCEYGKYLMTKGIELVWLKKIMVSGRN